jgi:uncharacterized protein YjbJ (UPF0337 family)
VRVEFKLRSSTTQFAWLFEDRRKKKESCMNKNQIKGDWNELKGEIKRRWGKLTDDDLTEAEGDMQKLAGKIQKKTGDDQQVIERWLRDHSA